MFQAAKELETKRQSRGFLTFCLPGDLGACIVKLLGLESTAPSAVPTRAAWPAKFRGSAWRDLSRTIPSVPVLSRCRTSILPLTRILCDGTNHRSGGRSAHRDLGTRESRGFKGTMPPLPNFSSSQVWQGPSGWLHSLAWYQMTTVNESPTEIQYCMCTTHRHRLRSYPASIMPKPLQMLPARCAHAGTAVLGLAGRMTMPMTTTVLRRYTRQAEFEGGRSTRCDADA